MTPEEMSECRFVEDLMVYFTYEDFYINRKLIKRLFKTLSDEMVFVYKMFVYANINTSMVQKNAIWEYLNESNDEYIERDLRLLLNKRNGCVKI